MGSYFSRATASTESKVLAKQVVVLKDKLRIPSLRERGIHSLAVTSAHNFFGAARHFVPILCEGESYNIYHTIQKIYVGNLQKLKRVWNHIKKYYMVDPLKIPSTVDSETDYPAV